MPELNTVEDITDLPPISEVMAKTISGFHRENAVTDLSTGIIQYCYNAASGVVYQIGSDKNGEPIELTGQTTFGDIAATLLADYTLVQFPDPSKSSFYYYFEGVKVEETGIKIFQTPATGSDFICYNSAGNMEVNNDVREVIMHRTLVSMIANNATANVHFADERHGIEYPSHVHLHDHMTDGLIIAKSVGGAEVYGLQNDATTFTKISPSAWADEDVRMNIPYDMTDITEAPFAYREVDGLWYLTTADNLLALLDTGSLQYNPISGGLTNVSGSDFVIMSIWLSNHKFAPVIKVVGQEIFTSRSNARKALSGYITTLDSTGMHSPEFHPIAAYIIHEADNGIYLGADGEAWYDYRFGTAIPKHTMLV